MSTDRYPGDLRRPQSWNRYTYGLSSPLNYVDPSGSVAIRAFFTNLSALDGSNYMYELSFQTKSSQMERTLNWAIGKRFGAGLFSKGFKAFKDFVNGKEAKTPVGDGHFFADRMGATAFEAKIQQSFERLGGAPVKGTDYYRASDIALLARAVDEVITQELAAGRITAAQAEQLRDDYDVGELAAQAHNLSRHLSSMLPQSSSTTSTVVVVYLYLKP